MLKHSKIVGFVATSSPDVSKHFYRDCLGLTLVEDSAFAMVFESADTVIRVQKTTQVYSPPYTTLGWEVDNIVATVRSLTDAGVQFERYDGLVQDDLGIWSVSGSAASNNADATGSDATGSRVAWFKDPDGNLLSVTQTSK